MTISNLTVMHAAAFVWFAGGIALLLKGAALAKHAFELQPDELGTFLMPLLGILIGLIKAKFIFIKSYRRNIVRIRALEHPKLWQCFRPRMLLFLAIIIPTGMCMSAAAAGKYFYLCLVCALDLSICTGLLVSSVMFRNLKAFSKDQAS